MSCEVYVAGRICGKRPTRPVSGEAGFLQWACPVHAKGKRTYPLWQPSDYEKQIRKAKRALAAAIRRWER